MHVTVAISTHNRSGVLKETMQSFFEIDLEVPGTFDLLVVDNASTDATRERVAEMAARHPGAVSYVFERALGVSNARNTALRVARGDLVALADDDIFFDRDWLRAIFDVMSRYPDAAGFAGQVSLNYEAPPPIWLANEPPWLNMRSLLGHIDFGASERYLTRGETPVGMNMGLRTALIPRYGDFSSRLDRRGAILLSKGESDIALRIYGAGLRIVYSPAIKVLHRVPPTRVTRRWMLKRMYWEGVSEAVLDDVTARPSRRGHLTAAGRALRHLLRVAIGASWAPRTVYWHFRTYRFWRVAYVAQAVGVIVRRLKLAITPER